VRSKGKYMCFNTDGTEENGKTLSGGGLKKKKWKKRELVGKKTWEGTINLAFPAFRKADV